MAERGSARISSRLKTPTPQPPSISNTPLGGRTTRSRATRSASRDVELPAERIRQTRQSTRQASVSSVDSVGSEIGQVHAQSSKKRHRAQQAAVADLDTVEEIDTQIAVDDAVRTPPRTSAGAHRSPGAMSEMSGTTAISSFSMAEAELLEPRFILRHLPRLYQDTRDFLDHLVPRDGQIKDDYEHMLEMQNPDSAYVADYNDYNDELARRLTHFRAEHQQYISPHAVQRALFGSRREPAGPHSGLNLVLYLANLVLLVKNIIHSDRNDKATWTSLRQLDNQFPGFFIAGLTREHLPSPSPTGESDLFQETLELALELRTQLVILYLEREYGEGSFNPDAALKEVFFDSQMSEDGNEQTSALRSWSLPEPGSLDGPRPPPNQDKIIERIQAIRQFFPTDEESLERGETVDLEGLGANFPWNSVVLRMLGWGRLRGEELRRGITELGGIAAIVSNINKAINSSTAPAPKASPRRKRMSLGKDRRRSSGIFNPNEAVSSSILDKLIAREKAVNEQQRIDSPAPPTQITHDGQTESPASAQSQRDVSTEQPASEQRLQVISDKESPDAAHIDLEPEVVEEARYTMLPPDEPMSDEEPTASTHEDVETLSAPPTSTPGFLQLLKLGRKAGKENRAGGYFRRQANAQRVEFETGFDDSQPTPGPSQSRPEGRLRSPAKRTRESEDDDANDAYTPEKPADEVQARGQSPGKRLRASTDSSDDDTFEEPMDRTTKIQEQRAKAKSNRPASANFANHSSAPTSHQPTNQRHLLTSQGNELVARPFASEEPESMGPAPPASTFESQRQLARANVLLNATKTAQSRAAWTSEQEEAFVDYMDRFPRKYAVILTQDRPPLGRGLLQNRTQVNLKDKARNMAIVMIKSGSGLKSGFEDIVLPTSAMGRKLIADGFEW